MIKSLIIFFSYLAFLLLGFFNADTVLIENNTPAVITPGTRSLVEVNVRKGDVQGFSKLELTLPDGFTATPGDVKGASFTFSGDKAKFVWMNLPEESMFKVTYYIESEPGIEGAYEIKGTFSYVRENIREDIYVPTRTVIVKQELTASDVQPIAPTVRVEEPVLEMSCERRIERLGDNEYLVKLKVNNNRIVGFGKILEVLPENCSTNRENDGGAVITQDANSIKFVWFEVPSAPSFEISYRVLCISDGTVPVIRGQLSYTENGNPYTVDVVQMEAPASLVQTPASMVSNTQTTSTDSASTAAVQTQANTEGVNIGNQNTQATGAVTSGNADQTTQPATEVNTQSEVTTNNNSIGTDPAQNVASGDSKTNNSAVKSDQGMNGATAKTDKKEVNKQSESDLTAASENAQSVGKSMPSAEKGIAYKVQIMAAHRVVDKTYLKKKFSFDEDYNIEHHNGWIKYTTGMFTQYKDARDARVRITSASAKLPGPFVTAYNDGERITVQEAILISKQLWYK